MTAHTDPLTSRPTRALGVDATIDGRLCRLTLCHPERRNALNEPLRAAIEEIVYSLHRRDDIPVILLAAEGPTFCAGADRREQDSPLRSTDANQRRQAFEGWRRLLDAFQALNQVTVAAVQGAAIGGGALLALGCDVRVAAEDATFRIPEVTLGAIPAAGGMQRLVRELGLPLARDLILTGRELPAEEAHRYGILRAVVPLEDLDGYTQRLVDSMLDTDQDALRLAKRALAEIARATSALDTSWADSFLMSQQSDVSYWRK